MLGYSLNASAGTPLLNDKINNLFKVGGLAVLRRSPNGLLDEVNIAVSQRY
jgi:hypothetical protein